MKERPILMSAPMVRALLDGSKTQTRRVCKTQPFADSQMAGGYALKVLSRNFTKDMVGGSISVEAPYIHDCCPHGQPGDRLWVRETWAYDPPDEIWGKDASSLLFRATYDHPATLNDDEYPAWKSSLFMPRWASRITLELTDVRVERLQDISNDDCIAEGIKRTPVGKLITFEVPGTPIERLAPKVAYQQLWQSINGPNSWDANPWVWALTFQRVTTIGKNL